MPREIKFFFNFTYLIPKLKRSSVVYKISCLDCSSFYIGKTKRHLNTRIQEHMGQVGKGDYKSSVFKNSKIYKYILNLTCSQKLSRLKFGCKNFEILSKYGISKPLSIFLFFFVFYMKEHQKISGFKFFFFIFCDNLPYFLLKNVIFSKSNRLLLKRQTKKFQKIISYACKI